MKKLVVIIFMVVLSSGVIIHSACAKIEGVYKTDLSEMSLHVNGDRIIGTYKYKGGKIDGVLKGNILTGTWIQTNARGRLEFVFADGFSSFEGKWEYDDAAPSRKWNGKKVDIKPVETAAPEIPVTVSEKTTPPSVKKPEPETDTIKITPASVRKGLLQPGQSVMYKDLEVTLLSLRRTNQYINGPEKGHVYAILRFRVKNMGSEQDSARIYSSLQWKDPASSMSNPYRRTTGVQLSNTRDYQLPPGAEGEFEEVYMFPENLSEAEFHLYKGYTKTVAVWLMPME